MRSDGLKCVRYSSSAGSVLPGEKWYANANGHPSAPATWAPKPLEPSIHICGSSPRAGVAAIDANG